jgi:hypothetical protein
VNGPLDDVGPGSATQTVGSGPVASRSAPAGTVPVGAEPVGAEPVGAEPVGAEPVEVVPVGAEPVEVVPVGVVPVGVVPVGVVPVVTVAAETAAAPEPLVVANEFAEVQVRRVSTRNGVRLEVRSPRLGRCVLLDALELEALTWQEPALFSELLAEPFGPSGSTPADRSAEPVDGATS